MERTRTSQNEPELARSARTGQNQPEPARTSQNQPKQKRERYFYIGCLAFKRGRELQSWPKIMAKTAKNGVVLDTTSNVQPI